ncbi:MAG: hypothetical protein KatS3mg031_1681 [Chitinophagales bacterium]|nr:MAG: hypothetical protein KatS3mg031_1681 [Chitinophagales bacterium]
MQKFIFKVVFFIFLFAAYPLYRVQGAVISGELKKWHRVTLLFDGPNTSEAATPNPFRDYRLIVTFTNGSLSRVVHGHYAADGDAANTSASAGNKWRVYFTPDATGTWNYTVSFRTGTDIALSTAPGAGTPVGPPNGPDGETGSFTIAPTDKTGNDFRAKGRLTYVGEHYLQFSETGEFFIKGGADSPENFLGYFEFDQTSDQGGVSTPGLVNGLHQYAAHVADWNSGDPVWQGNKGKGIIGALNYLASQGVNSVYFLTYNLDGGDGQDTWMWTSPTERYRFDVSKLDQWEIVFSHMDRLGIMLHVVTQETENDHALDGGNLGTQRKLYYRELVSRFAHHLGVFWNLGEENDNTDQRRADFAQYIRNLDPYNNPIGYHNWQAQVNSAYDGILSNPTWLQYFEVTSLQSGSSLNLYNDLAINYRNQSAAAGRKWVICSDEQEPAVASDMSNLDVLRKNVLWGNLMGGGGGVEWYFGYQGTFGDLQSEDFSVAYPLWQQTRYALDFFRNYLPFAEMTPDNSIVTYPGNTSTDYAYGFYKAGEVYAAYLKNGANNNNVSFNIAGTDMYAVHWYNPRTGGALIPGTPDTIIAVNGMISVGKNPASDNNDWVVLVRRVGSVAPAPEIDIRQGSNHIADGGSYTFAPTQIGSYTDVTFTIANTGTTDLIITLPISASGDFSVVSQPISPLAAGTSTAFVVRFAPTAAGSRTGMTTIVNNDNNESSYEIHFLGNGTVATTVTVWTGNVSDDWFNAANWTNGVPTASSEVVIPDVTPNWFPLLQGASGLLVEINGLEVQPGGQITISGSTDIELNVTGNFSCEGQILGTGKLSLSGLSYSLTTPFAFSGKLQIKSGTTLVTNGNLTLENGGSLLHGSGTPGGGGTVIGPVKVKRNGKTNPLAYSFWAAPVANAPVTVLGNDLYYYEPGNAIDNSVQGLRAGWVAASGNMTKGKGYIGRGKAVVEFDGPAHNGTITVPVMKAAGNNIGYNLIGNPYPSAIDANAFIAANSGVIYGSLYFWDDDGTNGIGWSNQDYAVWNGIGMVGGNGTSFNGHIASCQAFFVEMLNVDTTFVQFSNSMRNGNNEHFFKTQALPRLWLSALSPDSVYNETLIAFVPDATEGEDPMYDAKKIKGNEHIAFYSNIQSVAYAIQALPPLTDDRSVVIGLDAGMDGIFTISLKTIENFDETVCLYLEDTYTGTIQNLRIHPHYSFSVSQGTHPQRFMLHFTPPLLTELRAASCRGNDGEIAIYQAGSKTWNYVFSDAHSGFIYRIASGFQGQHLLSRLEPGLYRLELIDTEGYTVIKELLLEGKPVVSAAFTSSAYTVQVGDPVVFTNLSAGALFYHWDFGDGNSSTLKDPTYVYVSPGSYRVVLVAANDECADTLTIFIEVREKATALPSVNYTNKNVLVFTQGSRVYIDMTKSGWQHAVFSLFNLLGDRLMTGELAGTSLHTLEVPLPPAVGFICITNGKHTEIRKLIFTGN